MRHESPEGCGVSTGVLVSGRSQTKATCAFLSASHILPTTHVSGALINTENPSNHEHNAEYSVKSSFE